jgi:hypothetical protein
MQRPLSLLGQRHFQRPASAGQSRVVGYRQLDLKQFQQGAHKTLDLAVGLMKEFSERQHRLDGQVAVEQLSALRLTAPRLFIYLGAPTPPVKNTTGWDF